MAFPKGWLERLRSRLSNLRNEWRFHANKLEVLPINETFLYMRNLGARKLKDLSTNASIWWWTRICRFYIRRALQIPSFLRRKMVSGIRMVTLEAVRSYSMKPFKGNIAVFLASERVIGLNSGEITPWSNATSGQVQVHWLPGDHTTAFDTAKC